MTMSVNAGGFNSASLLMEMQKMMVEARRNNPNIANSITQMSGQMGVSGVNGVAGDSNGFSETLKNAIEKVNELQNEANKQANAFVLGDDTVELSQVMVAMQKSNLAFQAATEVRNKVVSAYQEIMNMTI